MDPIQQARSGPEEAPQTAHVRAPYLHDTRKRVSDTVLRSIQVKQESG